MVSEGEKSAWEANSWQGVGEEGEKKEILAYGIASGRSNESRLLTTKTVT